MAAQLMLFQISQEKRPDGSFLIVPTRVYQDREITVDEAMKLLRKKTRKAVYRLLDAGRIKGWKSETERGNGQWHIYESSVTEYKARNSN